ncbi:hypothetical protein AVEN_254086-2-1, partial [Araneus ventricosus]
RDRWLEHGFLVRAAFKSHHARALRIGPETKSPHLTEECSTGCWAVQALASDGL